VSNMWPMMKGFAHDLVNYGSTLKRQDSWIRKHAANKGWSVNPRAMVYANLRLWLSDCETMYGMRYCPCFEPTGDRDRDRSLVCPCTYAQAEIDTTGWCHCTLFGRADLTPEDYKRAEAHLMAEYRDVPLHWTDGVLDTRGMPVDGLRGIKIPDAVHQAKRALNSRGVPLTAVVSSAVEAAHLERLAEMRRLTSSTAETSDGFRVTITKR